MPEQTATAESSSGHSENKKEVGKPTTKKPLRTPSLSALEKLANPVRPAQKQPEADLLNEPVTEETFREAWKEFAMQRQKFQVEFQLLQQPVELRGHVAVVQVFSALQEAMLQELRSDLTAYLRQRLRNQSIEVRAELQTPSHKPSLYTNKEKLNYLAEKNPLINELSKAFGLDPDF
ncbi:MAG: hypothetical protein N2044_08390 [Cyclobacteriaceae bacterium]|nr:hypothetical protein [Cyclobacteriaceae bacterium]MCX7637847.1 hypothetical protein [Cyclobacteriaceae bacterium]MDW8331552.1 hypothetical protein [Cyclobacteriaceae bacterium]